MEDYTGQQAHKRASLGEYDYSPDEFRSAIVRLDTITALLPGIAEELQGEGYKQKVEYHVTLIPDELFDDMGRVTADALSAALKEVCDKHSTVDLSNGLYAISKPKVVEENGADNEYGRESIVIPLAQESDFVHDINAVYANFGLSEEKYPFLHVTLFTRPNNKYADMGIGIASRQAWHDMEPKLYGYLEQSS